MRIQRLRIDMKADEVYDYDVSGRKAFGSIEI